MIEEVEPLVAVIVAKNQKNQNVREQVAEVVLALRAVAMTVEVEQLAAVSARMAVVQPNLNILIITIIRSRMFGRLTSGMVMMSALKPLPLLAMAI